MKYGFLENIDEKLIFSIYYMPSTELNPSIKLYLNLIITASLVHSTIIPSLQIS